MTRLEEFEQRLRAAGETLLRTVARTDEELATLEAHQPGALDEDSNRELAAALLSRLEGHQRRELDEIHAAQARLAAGSFGVCERCGKPISLIRL